MKQIITLFTFVLFFLCNAQAQVPSGTYVPKNDIANAAQFTKFEFTGGKNVKVHFGMSGISIGAYEYIYTLNGSSLSLSEAGKNGSVEFTYNKATDEISLAAGLYGSEGAVWKKDGTSNNPTATNPTVPANKETIPSGKVPSGTYVPKNDVAKASNFTKFEFTGGNKVKGYIGMNGVSIGSYDYIYRLNGNTLSLMEEGKNGSVEFTYDKVKDEISLHAGAFGTEGAVWHKNGKKYCNEIPAPLKITAPKTVNAKGKCTLRWEPVECATKYIIHWSFFDTDNKKKDEGHTEWIDKCEYIHTAPNDRGYLYFNVYAKDDYKEGKKPLYIEVEVKKGQLIFLTHGLADSLPCFKETVKSLNEYDNYFDLGYVTMRKDGNYINKPIINEKICQGINILVRTEFSKGNLSFKNQLGEMKTMVGLFEGINADIVFIGHSMGGLASINYVINNPVSLSGKKIKIITVSTPYQPNYYAKCAWNDTSGTCAKIANQERGEAHRDLGGISTALLDLRNKWNYSKTESAKLYSISISMYSKLEIRWKLIGDGIVDIPAQQGDFREELDNVGEWYKVNKREIIFGTGISTIGIDIAAAVLSGNYFSLLFSDAGGINDRKKPGYHTNTPSMPKVIEEIKKIIEE